jgi:hypothetical protein
MDISVHQFTQLKYQDKSMEQDPSWETTGFSAS